MELITGSMRKAIKKMVYVSQCARALTLRPTPEHFANMLMSDMKIVSGRVNSISTRINGILDAYSSIPGEFLFEGFDEILGKVDNVNDYTKLAIKETSELMSNTTKTYREINSALSSAMSTTTSAVLQVGGGLSYDVVSMGTNIKLAMTGGDKREIGYYINDLTEDAIVNSNNFFESGGSAINKAVEWIDSNKNNADEFVDNNVGVIIEKVDNAKRKVENKIRRVKDTFNNFTKDFDDAFGFVNGNIFSSNNYGNGTIIDGAGEIADDVGNFVKNFNIGKAVTSIGGIVTGAGAATLAVDLLPSIDVDRMLREIMGGVDNHHTNKLLGSNNNNFYDSSVNLLDIPDVPWRLSVDDLEKYNADAYNKYIDDFVEENDKMRSEIFEQMQKVRTSSDLIAISKETKENKSALKAMRDIRRSAIKAKSIEKYKGFLGVELEYLKKECLTMKTNIKNEWDQMMSQYKTAIKEITNFFTVGGSGGNETVDRCCDRINEDANKIIEMCASIAIEMVNVNSMIKIPYSIGMCCDMPVHKVLSFLKDLQFIITFVKELIRLIIDIITQLSTIAKLIFSGFQNLADLLKKLKNLIGVNMMTNMVDDLVNKLKPMMIEGKLLMENAISPIYYNETDDYERRVEEIERLLSDDVDGGYIDVFKYTDDINARKKYANMYFGGYVDENGVEDTLEELESKGEREIVAYRSPLLNSTGDDFIGWIFYHADAYDNMKRTWSSSKKRKRNRVIKNASKKNSIKGGKLIGGVAELKRNKSFGYYNENGSYVKNKVNGFIAYYWYTKFTNDPTDCEPDFDNVEYEYDKDGNIIYNENFKESVVTPIQTTANGSLVELNDGRRVFVEGKTVKSGDFVNVNGVKYKVK